MALIEKKLGASGTARNWNTILKIGAMLCLALALVGACGQPSAVEAGERAFGDPRVSTSVANPFSCAFCHAVDPASAVVVPGRLDAGYNLAGAAGRAGYWGARQISLLDAINVCVQRFMGGQPLAPEAPHARQLVAYLEAQGGVAGEAATVTLIRNVTGLDGVQGDHLRGRDVYQRACGRCHGDPYTGEGRPPSFAHLVPEIPEHVQNRLGLETKHAVVGKVRQGMILGTGGVMPVYSAEALADADLADLLASMGL
jgi:thiosulfate dehydrogenase